MKKLLTATFPDFPAWMNLDNDIQQMSRLEACCLNHPRLSESRPPWCSLCLTLSMRQSPVKQDSNHILYLSGLSWSSDPLILSAWLSYSMRVLHYVNVRANPDPWRLLIIVYFSSNKTQYAIQALTIVAYYFLCNIVIEVYILLKTHTDHWYIMFTQA